MSDVQTGDNTMDERLKKQLDFLLEIDKEKEIYRQTHILGGSRRENDAEHAWHMAIMAILLNEYANEEIDVLNSIDDSSVDVVYIKSDDELIFISLDELFLDTQDALNRSNPIVTINVVALNFISYSRPFFVGL